MIFDLDAERSAVIAASLATLSLTTGHCNRPSEAFAVLRNDHPTVAVVVESDGPSVAFGGLVEAARERGIPTLAVVRPGGDPLSVVERVRGFDDWVAREAVERELPARVSGLLERAERSGRALTSSIAPRFLALVVHDLRTPLNVIGLTIRVIAQSCPQQNAEFEEDLSLLQENARQIERMLAQLGDYCRLLEGESPVVGVEFDPQRFLSDFLEDRQSRSGAETTPVRLEVTEQAPREVALDPNRARLAIQHALANAIAAAGKTPVRLRSSGRPGRWVIEFIVDQPPPKTVSSQEIRPEKFERLAGSPAERRGLDLAIAARISTMFGGTTRLEVEPDREPP